MSAAAVGVVDAVGRAGTSGLQAVAPTAVADIPPAVRAAAAFFLTVLFGGAVIYRYGGRVDEYVEASTSNPLVSVLYGLMAYGMVVFFVGYAYSQLATLLAGTAILATAVTAAFGVLVLSLGGLGFVVVGTWVAGVAGVRDPWLGLVGVGGASALVWYLLPFAVAGLVWLAIAAVGVGGPTRRWIHADRTQADRH
ncbi:hypothetical protein ACFO0N_21685 [Halobium salinum]|uniref:Uncharacterized protein n=1 Tax=Halobium salinum TaxID=1364940 RepID=A0ABD5PI22_9EURY|nr:hypothetical protein [Halobium salinum]